MKRLNLFLLTVLLPLGMFAQTDSRIDTTKYVGIRRFDTYGRQELFKGLEYRLEAFRHGDDANVRVVFFEFEPNEVIMTYASVITQIEKLEELINVTKDLSKPDHDIFITISRWYAGGLSITYKLNGGWDEPNIDYSYDGDPLPKGMKNDHNLTPYLDNLKKLKVAMEEFAQKYNYKLM